MASVKKFKLAEVASQIRHVERTAIGNGNIKKELLKKDYILSSDRGMDSYDYFLQRLSQVYWLHRKDVVVLIGWVITAPQELSPIEYESFFSVVYSFFSGRYGEENVVTAVVHNDEAGMPHEHILIIPIIPDMDDRHPQTERVLCKEVINKNELRKVHPDLQHALDVAGVKTNISTGITARQGGNTRVRDWKEHSICEHGYGFEHEYEFHFGRD